MTRNEPVSCTVAVKTLSRQTFPVLGLKGEVNQETLFSLEELAQSDVFSVQSDWSKDIASLRHLAVQNPRLISEAFIFQHFTTLRLVDRNINEVDKGLLKFTNLEELSLTGNSLTAINGSHLPRSLKSLQLFANKLEELDHLTINPPTNLQHLGVGYNKLSDISSYISPYFWPNLLSLDLSNNKISRLRSTLDCLSLLPSLRNLSLMNNPITLAPGYTGCTLDLMSDLQILDDVSISDDGRLHFANISQIQLPWDQAIFCVSFPVLENLRKPPENEPVDEAAFLFPVQKKHSYLIRFEFLSDTPSPSPDIAAPDDTSVAAPHPDIDAPDSAAPDIAAPDSLALNEFSKSNTAGQGTGSGLERALESPATPVSMEINEVTKEKRAEQSESPQKTLILESEALPWEDNSMTYLNNIIVRCSDLLELETYLSQEVQFTVVEKIVDSFTAIAPPDLPSSPTPSPTNKKKGGKDDKKKKKDDPAAKPIKDKDGNLLRWVDGEAVFSDIAHIKVDISDLISGTETSLKRECTVTEKSPAVTPPDDGRLSCASTKGKGGKKGPAAAGGAKKKAVATPVPTTPPEPLRLEYKMERVKWGSVEECKRWVN